MSLEAIKSIGAAEDEARQAKQLAQQKAQEAIDEAERNGREALSTMNTRAQSEIAMLLRTADQKAAENAIDLASTTANRKATLRARAESRYDKAAGLIVERIVNG